MLMFWILLHTSTVLPLIMNIALCMATCYNGEYEINGQCCPMCDPGKRVLKHCNETISITCVSCTEMTYTNSSNGLTECLPCAVCDSSNGLSVMRACTLTSDTLCEPLPGHYCISFQQKHCSKAREHSPCSPGQYINQTGTEFQDTVCADCPAGSYSDGTLCNLHANCESLGKITVKSGTETDDAECSNAEHSYVWPLIAALCGGCVFAGSIVTIVYIRKKKQRYILADQNYHL